MPRRARVVLLGMPVHVIQRDHDTFKTSVPLKSKIVKSSIRYLVLNTQ